jgi:hypothetical protein
MNMLYSPQTPQPLVPVVAPITSVVGVVTHDAPDSCQTLQQSPDQLPNTPAVNGFVTEEVAAVEGIKQPEIVPDWIKAYVRFIHQLAAPLAGQGKIVATAFGEDPHQNNPETGKPGLSLRPRIIQASVGEWIPTLRGLEPFVNKPHHNIYMPLAVFRPDLSSGSKGFERDVIACLGIVADFDDPEASRWAERLPMPPNYASSVRNLLMRLSK